MEKAKRIYAFMLALSLVFGMLFVLPAAAENADEPMLGVAAAPAPDAAVPNDIIIDEAPDGEAADILAAPEEATDAMLLTSADEPDVFTGNKIGKFLDKTFYKFDYAIFTAFSKVQKEGFLTTFVNAFTKLGDTEFAIGLLVVAIVLCLFKKTRKYGLALFLAIIIGTLFTNVVLKNVCGRARPYVTLSGDADFMNWYTRVGSNVESDNSFPSGHTTCALEIATALFLVCKNKAVKWIFPVYGLGIACSRIYLMVHYPTDVLAGLVVGICAGIIAYVIVKTLYKKEDSKLVNFNIGKKA